MSARGTIVKIDNAGRLSDSQLYCTTNKGVSFYLSSFTNGILKIEPKINSQIGEFASMVAHLFDPTSNFFGVKRVTFEFNGIPISVSKKNATTFLIVKQYEDKCKKQENNSK